METRSARAGAVNHTRAVLFVRFLQRFEFVCSGGLNAFMLCEGQIVERWKNENIFHVSHVLSVGFVTVFCLKCVFDPVEGSSAPLLTSAAVVMSRLRHHKSVLSVLQSTNNLQVASKNKIYL